MSVCARYCNTSARVAAVFRRALDVSFESHTARLSQHAGSRGLTDSVWLVNATLVTMETGIEGHDVISNSAVLLSKGCISRVVRMSAFETMSIDPQTTVMNLAGGS